MVKMIDMIEFQAFGSVTGENRISPSVEENRC